MSPMSYTSITAMRSNRYPLMGCGCGTGTTGTGCGCNSHSMGATPELGTGEKVALGVVGLGLFWFFSQDFMRANGRKRR